MKTRLFTSNKNSNDSTASSTKLTPAQVFTGNLPKNIALALFTVPSEGMALRRIFYTLDNPNTKPITYTATFKSIGVKGLFAGTMSRTTYCLTGNFATLIGIDYFGSDYQGLFKTTVAKNAILPLFLASNARQTNRNVSETFSFMAKGAKDPVVHLSFFFRNLVANSCLLPGFMVRDYCYQVMNETNTKIPTLLGFTTSVTASTLMNAFLKPFFTGIYPVKTRWTVAASIPAKLPLMFRECASLGLVFGNTSPKKGMIREAEATVKTSHPKFKS